MIILRDKTYSGYQPTYGASYNGSSQLKQGVDDGIVRVADHLDTAVQSIEGIHPVVDKASGKWRNRIKGYTKPIKRLLGKKKEEKKL